MESFGEEKEPPISTLNEAEIKEVEKSMPSKEETEEIGEKIKYHLHWASENQRKK